LTTAVFWEFEKEVRHLPHLGSASKRFNTLLKKKMWGVRQGRRWMF